MEKAEWLLTSAYVPNLAKGKVTYGWSSILLEGGGMGLGALAVTGMSLDILERNLGAVALRCFSTWINGAASDPKH